MSRKIDTDRFPEWQPFVDVTQQGRPDAGTWCEAREDPLRAMNGVDL